MPVSLTECCIQLCARSGFSSVIGRLGRACELLDDAEVEAEATSWQQEALRKTEEHGGWPGLPCNDPLHFSSSKRQLFWGKRRCGRGAGSNAQAICVARGRTMETKLTEQQCHTSDLVSSRGNVGLDESLAAHFRSEACWKLARTCFRVSITAPLSQCKIKRFHVERAACSVVFRRYLASRVQPSWGFTEFCTAVQ